MTALPLLALVLAANAASARHCQGLYDGIDGPRDLPAALACFRADEDWLMVTVMLLNGEGAKVDVAGARAAFRKLLDAQGQPQDADAEALQKLLAAREARPRAPAKRIDFCRDVAQTTLSMNACEAREDSRDEGRARALAVTIRARLAPPQQSLLDELAAAAIGFIAADGQRLYQKYADGSIRNLAALGQQRVVRKTFEEHLRAWSDPAATLSAARPLEEVDRELNAVYKKTLADSDAEYQQKTREAQRLWIRYRDAFVKLVSALQPPASAAFVERTIRSVLTRDRITELKKDPVGPE